MNDEFNTWGKVWTYVLIVLVGISGVAMAWAINVYSHWEPALKRNRVIAQEANSKNIQKIQNMVSYARKLKETKDTLYLDSIIEEGKYTHRLITLAEKKKMDSIQESKNIIDSVFVDNINQTWMSVMVRSEVKCQAVAKYGTKSGEYTKSGKRENSFTYNNHSLRIGNIEPLKPGTTYYIRVEAVDSLGNVYLSPEIIGSTLSVN